MTTLSSTLTPRRLLASLVIAFSMAGVASAMPPVEQKAEVQQGRHEIRRQHPHGLRALQQLHDNLKLDAKQEALWQKAAAFDTKHRQEMVNQHKTHHEALLAMLDRPNTDMHAVMRFADEFQQANQKERDALHKEWFTVYDSLNNQQKEQVRLFFKAKFERPMMLGKHHNDRHRPHQGRNRMQQMPDAKANMSNGVAQ